MNGSLKNIGIIFLFFQSVVLISQQRTYCNPVNIDYGYTPWEHRTEEGKHRTTADPVIVNFRNKYFLFSTNQQGYWWSENMLHWHFISRKFLLPRSAYKVHDINAPGVFIMKDTLYVYGSSHQKDFPLWKSGNPTKDDWQIATDTLKVGAWDPGFLYDKELDKLYLYWGSSNEFPLLGTELNTQTFQSDGYVKPLIKLHPDLYGWERFGEYNDNVFLMPFIEGAEMIKHNGKYYIQYGAPGTEFSGYADGVYVSESPMEKFIYQSHNPFSYKPGGYARGAGHGATFQDNRGQYWHVSTIAIGVKNNFERRIGIWPAGFDQDDVMYCNTAYGDYPTYIPEFSKSEKLNNMFSGFSGWMLLNYQKPIQVSSTLGGFHPNFSVDEDIKTYWSAKSGDKGEWIQTDLGEISTINAIQINYADQDAEFIGKSSGVKHQYKVWKSDDAKKWSVLIDKSNNQTDIPHEYVELENPIKTRFLKLENIAMPTGKFAISGFRVFGKGNGSLPEKVENFIVLRTSPNNEGERRNSWIKWKQSYDADGYVIYFGKSPDKLYGSIMVYGKSEYFFTGMDENDVYYFQIEAFNSSGIGERTEILKCE